jgi:DNA adenine methylase
VSSAVAPSIPGLETVTRARPQGQLLKWVGNKFRQAHLIAGLLPESIDAYYEPFVGTGAVLATVSPARGIAGDSLPVLIDFHRLVQTKPEQLVSHYALSREQILERGRPAYEEVKKRFNAEPNPKDLLVISRTCYGGVMRFTRDGRISTPMGPHTPMSPEKLAGYMVDWRDRLKGTSFVHRDFRETMADAGEGAVVYCDPPYLHGQSILYGAQDFRTAQLWTAALEAVERGARVVVSIDGWRRSGAKKIALDDIPEGLFERELLIERGGCMLRRFQMSGEDMQAERVADRLLLSW